MAEPLGYQLRGELRDAIRTGRLAAGERLPSSRVLARELGVSRGLVLECYEQLRAEGYLVTRSGSATRVAAGVAVPVAPATLPETLVRLDVDFRYGVPDLTSFPVRDWLWALGEAARGAPAEAFGYPDPHGAASLRRVLAAYLRRVRACVAEPGHIVVCAGFAQGVNLVLGALATNGIREVALEDPGDRDNDILVERHGLRPVPVRVDEGGVDVDALARTGARAVILTPAHQSPTGVVLSPERRTALLAWAQAVDATIIEDDYDAEFRYDRLPVGSRQGLAPDRVVTLGSVSKSVAPALRLGWVVCPPGLAETVVHEKSLADRGSPALEQLALARLVESGRYDKHLRRMRTAYASRRHALVDALGAHAPEVELRGLAAGFHAVARLPGGCDEQAVVNAARARSVGVYGMSRYRCTPATGPAELVLGFGNVTETSIHRGIATIGDLLSP